MDYCRYSIIPTPKTSLCCSSCGKKLEDLPYYPQIIQFFTCIREDANECHHIGLGLGVPMCEDCNDNVLMQIEKSYKQSDRRLLLLWCVYFLLTLVTIRVAFINIALGVGLFVALLFYTACHGKIKFRYINNIVKGKGQNMVDSAIDYLKNNEWRQDMSVARLRKNYSTESLKEELDGICAEGRFCLLDNQTGHIVDYHDPETMETIFQESICVESVGND